MATHTVPGCFPATAALKRLPTPCVCAGKRSGRTVRESRDDDPGLVLISRRPPQQKYANFEEYMEAHGGATAPIEDHSQDY